MYTHIHGAVVFRQTMCVLLNTPCVENTKLFYGKHTLRQITIFYPADVARHVLQLRFRAMRYHLMLNKKDERRKRTF